MSNEPIYTFVKLYILTMKSARSDFHIGVDDFTKALEWDFTGGKVVPVEHDRYSGPG
jgi:hypothetical protein